MGRSQHFDEALASNKVDSGMKLVVKNTFLNFEEAGDCTPERPQLYRRRTSPDLTAGRTGIEVLDEGLGESNLCQSADMLRGDSKAAEPQGETTSDDLLPSAPPELKRLQTFDAFEAAAFLPGSAQIVQQLPMCQNNLPISCTQLPSAQCMSSVCFSTGQVLPWEMRVAPNLARPVPPLAATASNTQASGALTSDQVWETLEPLPEKFQRQTLSQWRNRMTGSIVIHWTVDAKKLLSNDRNAVSPLFKLSDGHVNAPPLPFKMIITPKAVSDGKGGASFRMAKGRGAIQLKCEAPRDDDGMESSIRFSLSAWSGREEHPFQPPRGPVDCNFARNSICGLPKKGDHDIWDFNNVVDKDSETFVICLEVSAPGA